MLHVSDNTKAKAMHAKIDEAKAIDDVMPIIDEAKAVDDVMQTINEELHYEYIPNVEEAKPNNEEMTTTNKANLSNAKGKGT
ncbi:hypothetical protein GOP47_0005921 [Adiantum capillus-veneris]|uniref:Uncharacterized protein n=1 Tax=Adiantum capillus-veneris TaxID=13818 RepID=A0A9D4ZMK2_ADICA|nr:hypothetical protein GOP47_0005921 [Adiantum capillus-veneris]